MSDYRRKTFTAFEPRPWPRWSEMTFAAKLHRLLCMHGWSHPAASRLFHRYRKVMVGEFSER